MYALSTRKRENNPPMGLEALPFTSTFGSLGTGSDDFGDD